MVVLAMSSDKFYVHRADVEVNSGNDAILIPLDIKDIEIISNCIHRIKYFPEFVEMSKIAFRQNQVPGVQAICRQGI